MLHHTKDKGDLAVGEVIADLIREGAQVCLPISEHLPFDLIAVSPSMKLLRRVQVNYVSIKNGMVQVPLRRTYADRHGIHKKLVRLEGIDAFALFCPDTGAVYYVRRAEIPEGYRCGLNLRVVPSRNGQEKHVRPASGFVGANRIFER